MHDDGGRLIEALAGPVAYDRAEYARRRAEGNGARVALLLARTTARLRCVGWRSGFYPGQDEEFPIRMHGRRFTVRVSVRADENSGAPWEDADMLIAPVEVRRFRDYDSRGLRELGRGWGYNFRAAVQRAIEERCHDPVAAVQAEEDFLRGWFADDWYYVGVWVRVDDAAGREVYNESLWGIESDYAPECTLMELVPAALAVIGQDMAARAAAWRKALRVARCERALDRAEVACC